MRYNFFFSFIIILSVVFTAAFKANTAGEIILKKLQTEMLVNPEGIDVREPRLSWEIYGDQRGIEQTAYQVLVASTPEKLAANEGDLWNSGKVSSSKSALVPYEGKRLESRSDAYWKVKVWTNKGESGWSEPAYWSMGLLYYDDWKGRWIGMDRASPWDSEETWSRLSA